MPELRFQGHRYALADNETVLDALLRQGVEVPNSCRSGSCQSCLMQATEGHPPETAQRGLKPTRRSEGWFLACQCRPDGDLTVALPDADTNPLLDATVVELSRLGGGVMRLRLKTRDRLAYRPGQFVNLHGHGGAIRSYSLASVPDLDDQLELHVRRLPGGAVSGWVHEALGVGDGVRLQGPVGDCFYLQDDPERPLLLIGTGSGLAPLWGIARDALRQGHRGPVHLYHGAAAPADLYLHDELKRLDAAHANFRYHGCVSDEQPAAAQRAGLAPALALSDHPDLSGWRVYLCGNPAMVAQTRRAAFMAGARMQDILADPFLPAGGAANDSVGAPLPGSGKPDGASQASG